MCLCEKRRKGVYRMQSPCWFQDSTLILFWKFTNRFISWVPSRISINWWFAFQKISVMHFRISLTCVMFVNVLVAFYELSFMSDSFNIELSFISLSNYSGFYIGGVYESDVFNKQILLLWDSGSLTADICSALRESFTIVTTHLTESKPVKTVQKFRNCHL